MKIFIHGVFVTRVSPETDSAFSLIFLTIRLLVQYNTYSPNIRAMVT